MERLPPWLSAVLVGSTFVTLWLWESRRPLRRSTESKTRREARNFVMAGFSFVAIQAAEMPVTLPLTGWVDRSGWGLLQWMHLPRWAEVFLAVLLLDYTLYVWHILMHKVPWLWRLHQPHHVDLDMDTSTAIRFHFTEMIASVPWRVAQIVLIGVSPLALSIWQTATLMEVMFHHSNVKLPVSIERWLCRVIVTPRMHGIHHSTIPNEQNSNWSSGLTIWDWLHKTLRLNVPQGEIIIGVAAYQDARELTLGKILAMPFRKLRPQPEDKIARSPADVPRHRLLE